MNSENSPARVLLVFGWLNRGGAETLAMNIFRNVDRSKLMFDFLVHTEAHCDYDDEVKGLGGKIYRFPQYNVLNHFKYKKCWNNFLSAHPEYKVVHAHMTGPAAVFVPIVKKHGRFAVTHSHINSSQKGIRQAVINLYRYPLRSISDYMFACSENAGEWMFGRDIAKRPNYSVLKNGIDVGKFLFSEESRNEIRKELNLENKFVITNISRFHIQKNHSLLIDVFNEVHKRCERARLLLVGDGELREEIKKKVDSLGLSDYVIFTGVRTDIEKILSAVDVFVMTSFNEGLPVSLVEAQASGVRVIVTDTVSKEIELTNLVERCSLSDSPEKWADKILQYENGYERRNTYNELKSAGYDIKDTAKKLQEFYLEHYR